MSMWNLSDGSNAAAETSTEFEMGGGNTLLPNGAQVLAYADEVKWDVDKSDNEAAIINVRWRVAEPEDYKNRVVFQKVKINNSDPKKRDKNIKMLQAIATNAGGELLKIESPSDADLQRCLLNKFMMLKVGVWEIEKDRDTGDILPVADRPRGNWVMKVAAKGGLPVEAPKATPSGQPVQSDGVDKKDEDVPF